MGYQLKIAGDLFKNNCYLDDEKTQAAIGRTADKLLSGTYTESELEAALIFYVKCALSCPDDHITAAITKEFGTAFALIAEEKALRHFEEQR